MPGPIRTTVALVRLPFEAIVALEYTLRQVPPTIQDVRCILNRLARMFDRADPAILGEVLASIANVTDPRDGSLAKALEAAADLARDRSQVVPDEDADERRDTESSTNGQKGRSPRSSGRAGARSGPGPR